MLSLTRKHQMTAEERALVDKARAIKLRVSKAAKKDRPKPVRPTAPGQRDPRERDAAYLSWLHYDIPCIACLIEGPGPAEHRHIEAAHQKVGKQKILGRRPHDRLSCALCAWHHRVAPGCCDPAQTKFWGRLQVDPAALCAELHAAFKSGARGAPVVLEHAASRQQFGALVPRGERT